MTKKIILAASIVLLAAACHKQVAVSPQPAPVPTPVPAPSPAPNPSDSLNTYTSPDKYGFSIKYGGGFGFATDKSQVTSVSYIPVCDDNMVACVYLIRDTFKATNFDGAGVSINIDPGLNTEAKCYNFKVSTNAAQTPAADATINGVVFKSATGGDAGAGHFDNVKVFRNFHSNQCYEISTHIGSTNIDNYPKGTVSQFDENAVWQKLQDVVNTFTFTVQASASATLKVSEWGIAITKPTDLPDLVYTVSSSDPGTIYFSTNSLVALDSSTGGYSCAVSMGPVGALSRVKNFDEYKKSGHYIPENLQLGNYYYFFTHPQATCSGNTGVQELQTKQINSLQAVMLKNIKIAQ